MTTMTQKHDFPVFDEASAPAESRPVLAAVKAQFGFVPNLIGMLAGSPAAAQAYAGLAGAFGASNLSATEQHVVLQTVNVYHGCHYCVPAHGAVAAMSGVPGEIDRALCARAPLADPRLEALSAFTRALVERRGRPAVSELERFLAAGYTPAQVLDVIAGVALKTMSNYANHVAETPLDVAFAGAAA
jgi:uncharacterized peroxidase-related enzyme